MNAPSGAMRSTSPTSASPSRHSEAGTAATGSLPATSCSVRRYAEHLADLGIPVQAQRGRYGGYRLAAGYKLPPLMLTDDEAVAVVLGLRSAERAGLATTAHAATASALAKVSREIGRAHV